MTSDYLNIKSLFYDDESILEGMKALRDRDKKLTAERSRDYLERYVNENHGNEQQISLELAQNPDLIKGLGKNGIKNH